MEGFLRSLLKYKPIIFIDNFLYRIKEDNIFGVGAQLSYSLLLSLFPFLIVFLNILSFISIERMDIIFGYIQYLPLDVQDIIISFMKNLAIDSSPELLSIAAIGGLWTASTGITPVIKAINRAYDYEEKRSYFKLKAMSLVFTIALILLIVLVFLTLVLGEIIGNQLFNYLGLGFVFIDLWDKARIVIPIVFMIIIFALLYKYSPCVDRKHRVKLRHSIPGGLFTTFGWIIASQFFAIYVNLSDRYSRTYGSLGGVIILLVWLYLSSIIMVLGGEFNASLSYFKKTNYTVDRNKSIIYDYIHRN